MTDKQRKELDAVITRAVSRQKVVYVAGPYRSELGPWGVHENTEQAKRIARYLWICGHAVICPHANTYAMDGGNGTTDDLFIRGDLSILERCDAVVVLPGWKTSEGTRGEIAHAEQQGIPVYYWPHVKGLDG